MDEWLKTFGEIPYSPQLRRDWVNGDLSSRWSARYPMLFDEDDKRLAENQRGHGYHFVEWLSAILIFEATNYLSLISKYEFGNHPRKREVVSKLFSDGLPLENEVPPGERHSQYPDLLVHKPDYSSWFFCEVKGPGDRLSESQRKFFQLLAEETSRPVGLLHLTELNFPGA